MDNNDRHHFEDLLKVHLRRLHSLELKEASYGLETPPQILIEIEEIRAKITQLKLQLGEETVEDRSTAKQTYSQTKSAVSFEPAESLRTVQDRQFQSNKIDIHRTNIINVFLCYSSSDKSAVRDLYNRLKNDRIKPWLDEEDLLAGQDWRQETLKVIRASEVVIVCLSHRSIRETSYVQKEIRYALDVADEQPEGTIFVIPLKLEECEVPERLRRWHSINLFKSRGYEKLLQALQVRMNTIQKRSKIGE